jgi:hypothetical protein
MICRRYKRERERERERVRACHCGGLPIACYEGAVMTDGPELEAVSLPAMLMNVGRGEGVLVVIRGLGLCINIVRVV